MSTHADSLVEKRLRYIERQRQLHAEAVNVDVRGFVPLGSGPRNRDGMPKLPVGQHVVKNWPVLDLGDMPDVPTSRWRLEVGGLVENPVTLTWADFLALPQAEDVSDFHCVTTWSRFDNRWGGVRFRTIAELAVPSPKRRSSCAPGTTSRRVRASLTRPTCRSRAPWKTTCCWSTRGRASRSPASTAALAV